MDATRLATSNIVSLLATAWFLPRGVLERGVELFRCLGTADQLRAGRFYAEERQEPLMRLPGRAFDWRSDDADEALLGRLGVHLTAAGTAVVPVYGVLAKRVANLGLSERGTSTDMLADAADVLRRSDVVRRVLGDFDTPGGSVLGTDAAASAFRALAAEKPTQAHVNDLMLSGGYYLGSQFARISAETTAYAGSIGVYTVRVEQVGEFQDEMGAFRVHVIASSREKVDGHAAVAFDDEEASRLQREVDTFYEMFVDAVAEGRGIERDDALALADGTVEIGRAALERGLVDEITTLSGALSRFEADDAPGGFFAGGVAALARMFTQQDKEADQMAKFASLFNRVAAEAEPAVDAEEATKEASKGASVEPEAEDSGSSVAGALAEREAALAARERAQQVDEFMAGLTGRRGGEVSVLPRHEPGLRAVLIKALELDMKIEVRSVEEDGSEVIIERSAYDVLCDYVGSMPALVRLGEISGDGAHGAPLELGADVEANKKAITAAMEALGTNDPGEAFAAIKAGRVPENGGGAAGQ